MKLKNLAYLIPATFLSIFPTKQSSEKKENKIDLLEKQVIEEKTEKEIPKKKQEFLENAKNNIGIEYKWGGRKTERLPGLDCMGAVFIPYANTFNENWKEYSVNPKKLIENRTLGKPVEGLNGVLSKNIDYSKLEEGDIMYFMRRHYSESPNTIKKIGGENFEVAHMGIYTEKEEKEVLNAFAPGTKVREHSLGKMIFNHFNGVYVTRPNWEK